LKSFTAGFFTTCGLSAVGSPCIDDGEELPLHGTISHIPSEIYAIEETEKELIIKLRIRDTVLFGRKLVMNRVYTISYTENVFTVNDTVTNEADTQSPYMIMYHCNMGYPLLNENSLVKIPNNAVQARNEHARKYIDSALQMEKPQSCYEERCYYYDVKENGNIAKVGIFSSNINKGLIMEYDKKALPCFTEWKMMGKTDYVLGLEPGNCTPDGRNVLRENNTLKFLQPDQSATTTIKFTFINEGKTFEEAF
jgi:galactose mutarotase-like enzyme